MEHLKNLADDMLVEMYKKGDNSAFDVLLERYQEKLYSYIYYAVKDRDVADDVFQETFVKAIVTIRQGRYSANGKFQGWLMRIAHNLIIDTFRHEKGNMVVSNDESEIDLFNDARLSDSNIEMQMVTDQSLVEVRLLMDELPVMQREVVYMRFFQDLSFKEIASATNVSINTALGRMRYALLNMRRMASEKNLSLSICG